VAKLAPLSLKRMQKPDFLEKSGFCTDLGATEVI
jgi:hypothetical protein